MYNALMLKRELEKNPDKIFIVDDIHENILASFKISDIEKVEIEKMNSYSCVALYGDPRKDTQRIYTEDNSAWASIITSGLYDFKILLPKDSIYGEDDYNKFVSNMHDIKDHEHTEGGLIKTPYLQTIAKKR